MMDVTFDSLKVLIQDQNIEEIDLKFVNLFGGLHHISLPVGRFDEGLLQEGIAFDSSSIPGFKRLESGDMVLLPLVETAFVDPFWERPTLSCFCQVAEADTRQPFARDPRSVALRAEEALVQSGVADRSHWGPEFEFYIFDDVRCTNTSNMAYYEIDSGETRLEHLQARPPSRAGLLPFHSGYHAIPPRDQLYQIRSEMVRHLEESCIPVRYHHHEVGSPGQSEIEVLGGPLVFMGDAVLKSKYLIKMIARQHNKTATFMPKPIYQEAGNGMHFHQQIFLGEEAVFYDREGYGGLSRLALSYIAGLLEHGAALLALTNPSTNSYKRLVPGYEAPTNAFFSLGNRSAAIRIPKYASSPAEKRIEFRPPDASCNPYLAMSAMLLAGLDGIRRDLDPSRLGYGPFDVNIFQISEKERNKIRPLPSSLEEALNALEKDHDFLLHNGVFTEDLLQVWIETKRQQEHREIQHRPHPYEIELYFDV